MGLTLDQALRKGIEAHKAGKVQEAARYYTAILRANPKHPDANHNMGVLAAGKRKVETALPFFKIAVEVNPKIAQYWLSYINALIKLNRITDAKAVFDQAKSSGAEQAGFDQIGKQLRSLPSKNSYTQEPSPDQLQSLIDRYTQGRYQEALNIGSQLLEHFPYSINLYNIIGAVNQGLGKLEKAIDAYTNALSIEPDCAEVHNNLGIALQEQGKLDEATDAYTKAISIQPDYADAYNNLGNSLTGQVKLEEAIDAYTKAISIKPDYADAYNNLGIALQEQGKLDAAIDAYTKAISIQPDYADAYNNLGNALKVQGKLYEATDAYTKAISIQPDYADAHNNLGLALQEQGKLEEAIEAYTKALSIKPYNAEAIINASTLRNQLLGTVLITKEFEKKLAVHSVKILENPKLQIQQAIRAFLLSDQKLVCKHLRSYASFSPSSIAKLKSKDQVFCSAYNSFLQKLIEIPFENEATISDGQTLFHLGESHCLSYAHKKIKIHGLDHTVTPRITFGGKAYHFSIEKENAFKAITKAHFHSLPDSSKVVISFGEIDCRPNEGFISAAKKYEKQIKNLVSDTVRGYVDWFAEQNKSKNHDLFFFNVPAPIYNEKYSAEVNGEVTRTIKLFNTLLHKTVSDCGFNLIDVYKFTVGKGGFSNGLFHIDDYHLSSDAIPEIEKQVGTFS